MIVGVSDDLGKLFAFQNFFESMDKVETTPEFRKQKDALLHFWITWTQDAIEQLPRLLLVATGRMINSNLIQMDTLSGKSVYLSNEKFLETVKNLSRRLRNALICCPFPKENMEELGTKLVNNYLNWAQSRDDIPVSTGTVFKTNV